MPKIKGRFAPLTDELGNDERFLLECDDFEKLMYILIIFTCHMTHHQAPINPLYYRKRYGIRARYGHITNTIRTLCERFPQLKCSDGKLSLLNSATYGSGSCPKGALEVEVEEDKRKSEFDYLLKDAFKKVFDDYLTMRVKIRRPATEGAKNLVLKQLHKYDLETAIGMLEQSIMNSWQGIFPLKGKNEITKGKDIWETTSTKR